MLIDFIILKRIVQKHVLSKLDHQDLNQLFPNPTTETVALWIWDQLKDLSHLLLQELEDPNLDQEIKTYLTSSEDINKSNQNLKLELAQIQLFESKTSFITLSK
jgi:6-pyruvoyl-tetrahydropterin synthase